MNGEEEGKASEKKQKQKYPPIISRIIYVVGGITVVVTALTTLTDDGRKFTDAVRQLWISLHPTDTSSESSDSQYKRLLDITRGSQQSTCAAEKSASKVQRFERGWLLYRYDYQKVYAIVITIDQNIVWASRDDDWAGNDVTCEGVKNEELLYGGFKKFYCDSNGLNLKAKLGEPLTKEIGVWVQYQDWSKGLLVFGLFPNLILTGSADEPIANRRFVGLDGVFLDNDTSKQDINFNVGRMVQYSFHNSKDFYCSVVWHPADNHVIPDDLKNATNCPQTVESATLVKGHNRCLLFGHE